MKNNELIQVLSALLLLALVGCTPAAIDPETVEISTQAPGQEGMVAPVHAFGVLPATFTGTLPCADCPGTNVHLNLLAGGVYFLRETYQDRDNGSFDDVGRYLLSSDNHQVTLHGGREAPLRFALSTSDTLTLLDRDGGRIESELNYSLARQPQLQTLEPQGFIGGQYTYLADAGRLLECRSGLDMPVATEADNGALEEAYLAAREVPGERLLVSLEGRIVERMPMEGPGPVWTLVPERFIGVWPGQSCPEPIRLADLTNTYWRLTLIDSTIVERAPNQREPHLVFHEDDGRLVGSDGCNRLFGSYAAEDMSIDLSGLTITRMACPAGMAQAEALRKVLGEVDRYRIVGQHLEILDEHDRLRLRAEAVALY